MKTYLDLVRSADDLAAQRRLKGALDPAGVLNPGVLGMPRPSP